jgi:hypothetical protein
MTISDDYKSVTMWDPDQHHQTQLDCRIQDEKSLKNYLNPYHESPLQKEDAALYKQLKEWQKWEEPENLSQDDNEESFKESDPCSEPKPNQKRSKSDDSGESSKLDLDDVIVRELDPEYRSLRVDHIGKPMRSSSVPGNAS